jgi:hypothetical protein
MGTAYSPAHAPTAVPVDRVYWNVGQDIVTVTDDKMELALRDLVAGVARRRDWLIPGGIAASFGIALVTADFKTEHFTISGSTWGAAFAIVAIGFALITVWQLFQALRTAGTRKLLDNTKAQLRGQ